MKVLGVTLIVISGAVLLLHFAGEFFVIDMCLDAGQVYDYSTSQCSADVDNFPYVPYVERFSGFILGSLLALLMGIAFVVIGKKKRQA